jgi:hypothetical protein
MDVIRAMIEKRRLGSSMGITSSKWKLLHDRRRRRRKKKKKKKKKKRRRRNRNKQPSYMAWKEE